MIKQTNKMKSYHEPDNEQIQEPTSDSRETNEVIFEIKIYE
jgi:hypothetical protein